MDNQTKDNRTKDTPNNTPAETKQIQPEGLKDLEPKAEDAQNIKGGLWPHVTSGTTYNKPI